MAASVDLENLQDVERLIAEMPPGPARDQLIAARDDLLAQGGLPARPSRAARVAPPAGGAHPAAGGTPGGEASPTSAAAPAESRAARSAAAQEAAEVAALRANGLAYADTLRARVADFPDPADAQRFNRQITAAARRLTRADRVAEAEAAIDELHAIERGMETAQAVARQAALARAAATGGPAPTTPAAAPAGAAPTAPALAGGRGNPPATRGPGRPPNPPAPAPAPPAPRGRPPRLPRGGTGLNRPHVFVPQGRGPRLLDATITVVVAMASVLWTASRSHSSGSDILWAIFWTLLGGVMAVEATPGTELQFAGFGVAGSNAAYLALRLTGGVEPTAL